MAGPKDARPINSNAAHWLESHSGQAEGGAVWFRALVGGLAIPLSFTRLTQLQLRQPRVTGLSAR